jgi:hypothetical protein
MHGVPAKRGKKPSEVRLEHGAQIVELACRGFRPREIMREMAGLVDEDTVRNTLTRARQENPDVPRFRAKKIGDSDTGITNFKIPNDTAMVLKIEADLRGISTSELVEKLLTVIANENMVDAVLDDKNDLQPEI